MKTGRDNMAKIKTGLQTSPQINPGESSGSVQSEMTSMPSVTPPSGMVSVASVGETVMVMADTGGATPLPITEGIGADITTWQNNKKINALWCINQNRNVFVGVPGIGWKKLADNSDSAIVALTMLSAHAFEKGSIVNYRDEGDTKIHEMYVW
jgi:hypothetical protein